MFDFSKEYPKTYYAMKTIIEAVREESENKDEFLRLALTAIGGVVMGLAMAKNDNDSERITSEDVMDAIMMIEVTREATMDTVEASKRKETGNALN